MLPSWKLRLYVLLAAFVWTATDQVIVTNMVQTRGSSLTLECPTAAKNCEGVQFARILSVINTQYITLELKVLANMEQKYGVNGTSNACVLYIKDLEMSDGGRIMCSLQTSGTLQAFQIFVMDSMPTCNMKPGDPSGEPVAGTTLAYNCDVRYSFDQSGGDVEMHWMGESLAPMRATQAAVSNQLNVNASPPVMLARLCRTTFGNRATSLTVNMDCMVSAINVFYPVTNIKLSRQGANFVPGTNVTCSADGFPEPRYFWQTAEKQKTIEGTSFTVDSLSSVQYQCVATNTVGGQPSRAVSELIMFNNTVNPDELLSASTVVWVVPLVLVLLALIGTLLVCCLWPICPLHRAVQKRRGGGNKHTVLKSNTGYSLTETVSPSTTGVSFSALAQADNSRPDVLPKPSNPHGSLPTNPRGSLPSKPIVRPPDAPSKKPARVMQPVEDEILYADLELDDKPRQPRPPRPSLNRQQPEDTIYTAVVRS